MDHAEVADIIDHLNPVAVSRPAKGRRASLLLICPYALEPLPRRPSIAANAGQFHRPQKVHGRLPFWKVGGKDACQEDWKHDIPARPLLSSNDLARSGKDLGATSSDSIGIVGVASVCALAGPHASMGE